VSAGFSRILKCDFRNGLTIRWIGQPNECGLRTCRLIQLHNSTGIVAEGPLDDFDRLTGRLPKFLIESLENVVTESHAMRLAPGS